MASAIGTRTGLDLRLRRTMAGLSQTAVAERLGVTRQRVGNIEGMLRPPPAAIERYLGALRDLSR